MLKPDKVRLQHMVDAANEALSFVAQKSRTELTTDRALALALVKSIEILGEAASKVSRELRSQSAEIPWADIRRHAQSTNSQLFRREPRHRMANSNSGVATSRRPDRKAPRHK